MKKSISIIAGCLVAMTSLFGCATGPARVYPTATPAANPPRSTVTHAPYHAAPRATAAPRTTAMPRNLVPNINTMPGRIPTPNISPYGHANPSMPRSGMTPRAGYIPGTGNDTNGAHRSGYGTANAPNTTEGEYAAPRDTGGNSTGYRARAGHRARRGMNNRARTAPRGNAPRSGAAPARGNTGTTGGGGY